MALVDVPMLLLPTSDELRRGAREGARRLASSTRTLTEFMQMGWARRHGKRLMPVAASPNDRALVADTFAAIDEEEQGAISMEQILHVADCVLGPGKCSEGAVRRLLAQLSVSGTSLGWFDFRSYMALNLSACKAAEDVLNQRWEDMLSLGDEGGGPSMRLADVFLAYYRKKKLEAYMKGEDAGARYMRQLRARAKSLFFDDDHGSGAEEQQAQQEEEAAASAALAAAAAASSGSPANHHHHHHQHHSHHHNHHGTHGLSQRLLSSPGASLLEARGSVAGLAGPQGGLTPRGSGGITARSSPGSRPAAIATVAASPRPSPRAATTGSMDGSLSHRSQQHRQQGLLPPSSSPRDTCFGAPTPRRAPGAGIVSLGQLSAALVSQPAVVAVVEAGTQLTANWNHHHTKRAASGVKRGASSCVPYTPRDPDPHPHVAQVLASARRVYGGLEPLLASVSPRAAPVTTAGWPGAVASSLGSAPPNATGASNVAAAPAAAATTPSCPQHLQSRNSVTFKDAPVRGRSQPLAAAASWDTAAGFPSPRSAPTSRPVVPRLRLGSMQQQEEVAQPGVPPAAPPAPAGAAETPASSGARGPPSGTASAAVREQGAASSVEQVGTAAVGAAAASKLGAHPVGVEAAAIAGAAAAGRQEDSSPGTAPGAPAAAIPDASPSAGSGEQESGGGAPATAADLASPSAHQVWLKALQEGPDPGAGPASSPGASPRKGANRQVSIVPGATQLNTPDAGGGDGEGERHMHRAISVLNAARATMAVVPTFPSGVQRTRDREFMGTLARWSTMDRMSTSG